MISFNALVPACFLERTPVDVVVAVLLHVACFTYGSSLEEATLLLDVVAVVPRMFQSTVDSTSWLVVGARTIVLLEGGDVVGVETE